MAGVLRTTGKRSSGLRNTLRFATDFVSLDGMPRMTPVLRTQSLLRHLAMKPFDFLGIDLASPIGARSGFLRDRPAMAHEAHSYWGIAGLLFLWPAVFGVLLTANAAPLRVLGSGTILFLVLQAISGPYDSFRGRYFLSAAVFACPLAVRWLRVRSTTSRAFVMVALGLVIVTAMSSALLRSASPLLTIDYRGTHYPSILRLDRAAQLTRNRRAYAPVFREYERLVPLRATVAVSLPEDAFEYPLFGPHLDRVVVPVGGRPLDDPAVAGADYLLFSEQTEAPRPSDIHLGEDWWLRPRR